MSGSLQRLTYMANQIARNVAALGDGRAVLMVADHIAAYWDPRMRIAILEVPDGDLDPIAAKAVRLLRTRGSPPHQTLATASRGGSDAG